MLCWLIPLARFLPVRLNLKQGVSQNYCLQSMTRIPINWTKMPWLFTIFSSNIWWYLHLKCIIGFFFPIPFWSDGMSSFCCWMSNFQLWWCFYTWVVKLYSSSYNKTQKLNLSDVAGGDGWLWQKSVDFGSQNHALPSVTCMLSADAEWSSHDVENEWCYSLPLSFCFCQAKPCRGKDRTTFIKMLVKKGPELAAYHLPEICIFIVGIFSWIPPLKAVEEASLSFQGCLICLTLAWGNFSSFWKA